MSEDAVPLSEVAAVPRAVFDCPLFVQAFLGSSGPAAACLDLVEAGQVRLLVSESVLAEVGEVLARPEITRKLRSVNTGRITRFLERVIRLSELVEEVPAVVHFTRDPKDEPYLNLAVAGRADYLVSRDRDLLDLPASGNAGDQEVRVKLGSVTILDPVSFLSLVR